MHDPWRTACRFLSVLSLMLGAAGMVLSFAFLSAASMADIIAGASGFVAGSVFLGAGLVALAMLACAPKPHARAEAAFRVEPGDGAAAPTAAAPA